MEEPAMSETTTGGNEGGQTPPAEGGKDQFEPITSQEDLNRVIGERLERERSKFSDYADLKAKADRFDELEAANKTELERAQDRAAAAEKAATAAQAEALRFKVASKHGISEEDAELFLTGTDEDTLTKQAQRLSARVDQKRRNGNYVPREGATNSDPKEDQMRQFARNLFQTAEQ
jgi:hypothetical protein